MASTNAGIDMSAVLAPIFVGLAVSLVLGGITVVQGYLYFPSKDKMWIQSVAISMLVMDFISTILVLAAIYNYLIPAFGSLVPFNTFATELSADCLLSTIITFISQLYFVYQLFTVTSGKRVEWRVLIWVILLCAIAALGGGLGCTGIMFIQRSEILAKKTLTFSMLFGIAKGFGAITDVLATIAMCSLLASSKTGITQTNNLVSSLMVFIVERGALVTLIQVLLVVMFYALPDRTIWLCLHMLVTKLYVNTFFGMLNGRTKLINEMHKATSFGLSSSQASAARRYAMPRHSLDEPCLNDTKHSMPMVTRSVIVCEA